jgi:nucleoside-diphosphate-sugar epimerase
LAAAPIDRVIHAAAVTAGPRREADDPQAIIDVNIGGTACLMATLKQSCPAVTRVVAMSSGSVYGFQDPGPAGHLHEERSCPAPAALYGITKQAAEQTALRLGEVFAIDTRAVRMSSVFGPWEYRTGVRDTMSPHLQVIEIAAARGTAILPRRGPADWIYSRDAAAGIRAVLDARQPKHSVYNLASRAITDLPAWCDAIASSFPGFSWHMAAAGEEPNVAHGLLRDRAPLDVSRIEQDIGFRNAFDLARAAKDYAEWAYPRAR